MALDRSSVVHPLPLPLRSHRPNLELPSVSHSRRTDHHKCYTRRETPAHTSYNNPKGTVQSNARFRDEELISSPPNLCVASQWTGRDRAGILVWAHSVLPGLPGHEEDHVSSTETSSMSDLDRFLSRRHLSFPLTTQNLAPPCVTTFPRHALLNHTSTHHLSNPEDRTAPSLTLDDASLLTPATDSVITPSGPYNLDIVPLPPPKTTPGLGSLINKVCTWIVSPSRVPRASAEGNPSPPSRGDRVAVHSDETASCCYVSHYGDKSSAEAVLSLTSPTDTRLRVTTLGEEPYDYDAA